MIKKTALLCEALFEDQNCKGTKFSCHVRCKGRQQAAKIAFLVSSYCVILCTLCGGCGGVFCGATLKMPNG